jgi:hypothetical protein
LSNSYAKESTVLFTLKLCNTKKAIVDDELQYMLLIDDKENLEHHVRHSLSWLNNVEDVMQYHEDFKSINSIYCNSSSTIAFLVLHNFNVNKTVLSFA